MNTQAVSGLSPFHGERKETL